MIILLLRQEIVLRSKQKYINTKDLTIASTMTTRPVMVCAASLRSWHKPRQARVAGEAYVRLTLRAGEKQYSKERISRDCST